MSLDNAQSNMSPLKKKITWAILIAKVSKATTKETRLDTITDHQDLTREETLTKAPAGEIKEISTRSLGLNHRTSTLVKVRVSKRIRLSV